MTSTGTYPAADVAEIGKDDYRSMLVRRRRDVAAAEAARDGEVDRLRGPLPMPATELKTAWPQLTTTERRELLALAFDCVILFPGTRHDDLV